MPSLSTSCRLEFGTVLFDGKSKILEVVNTTKKGQKVDESMVVKESPFCNSSMNEIRFLSQLKHKSIIRYRGYEKQHRSQDTGVCEDKVILFLEKAQGGDLYDQLCKYGKFSEDVARSLFLQMLDAVRFIHSQNIAHRDLKLENFLIMEKSHEVDQLLKCHLKLADFEFACERTVSSPRRKDRAGTERYLSPEQMRGDYCPLKSDMWALGIALYLMVCGKYPEFTCSNSSPARERELVASEMSPELRALFKGLLESDEQSRLTIDEVRKHYWTTGHSGKGVQQFPSPKADHLKKRLTERVIRSPFHLPTRLH
eukprot:TRINITY_DN7851_c0_g1_i1.p1 TRINITY_DN7851_c0_g1~~TRINITY_DN7851_c0_g1_i1.p1  ORF type:complete len:312 (-),score=43.85 TRINITY_DN7851_c0_g1_i1:64-999(-)